MDLLTDLLNAPRAQRAFLLRAVFDAPWAVAVRDEAPVTLVCAVRGGAWVLPGEPGRRPGVSGAGGAGEGNGADGPAPSSGGGYGPAPSSGGNAPVRLAPGDVAVVRGPAPYTVADDPATAAAPGVVVRPGGCSTTPDGADLCQAMALGVRTWGTSPHGADELLIGTYQLPGEVTRPLLRALPPLLSLRAADWDGGALLPLLERELPREEPGQEVVLDRLLDLLLISVLRAWFAHRADTAPAWHRAGADPLVGPVLRLIHDHPAHPWTVAGLAAQVGASRAALARRFTALVGEPPMAHLTGRRLALAADLLREPDATLEAVARRVGYGSAFALSAAFKRERGVSPRDHRSGGADATDAADAAGAADAVDAADAVHPADAVRGADAVHRAGAGNRADAPGGAAGAPGRATAPAPG